MSSATTCSPDVLRTPVRPQRLSAVILCAVVALGGALAPTWASQAVVLKQGGSTLQTYDYLKRVAVVDPAVADVIVTSMYELLLLGKAPGRTKVYVWDRAGEHELAVVVSPPMTAEDVVRKLSGLLDPALTLKALANKTVMVDGQLHSQSDVERAQKIIKAQSDGVAIVDLVVQQDTNLTPAERRAKALEQLLGPKYKYIIWDNETVVVDGQAASAEEAERVRKLVEASAKDFKAQSLVTYPGEHPDMQTVAQTIAKALGSAYKVWPLSSTQIAVEGQAPDADSLKRTRSLIQAFAKNNIEIVDLTAQAPEAPVSVADRVQLLQASLGKKVTVRSLDNRAIVVEGTVPTADEAANLRKLVAAVGQQVPVIDLISVVAPSKRQVMVRARVAEVDKSVLQKYGLDWGQLVGGQLVGQPVLLDGSNGFRQVYGRAVNVDALKDDTHTRILAEPNLVVADGEQAHLQVGGEIPVPVPQSGGFNTITIDYKQYGIILDITPKVLADGNRVELKIQTENSSLDTSTSITVSGFQIPGLRTRRVETILSLDSGQTFFMGGLVSNDQSRFARKIPILGDLPIIGQLFRHEQFQTGKTDLIILVTPEVMK